MISTNLTIVFIAALSLVILAVVIKTKKHRTNYSKHDSLLTKAELNFYNQLKFAIPYGYILCLKVRVADVLLGSTELTTRNKKEWYSEFARISQKHFDFLICKESDLSFLCAIELNDSSHKRKDRVQRDDFIRAACLNAKLPLIEVLAARFYDREKLTNIIENVLQL
ncbi:hypothetical protein C9J21_20380 [Photobacterium phosphoreum]|uniref:DUF2726 domain-containing protein n=1 Tax=Photobacterium phosphoreum TaxID=659 RepID=UPI000D17A1E2|nr:DUF2726 domain-containing protein [Photobacterium phosphoreum]PSW28707.1 hypothetical protein C9J21_20380 [Photobacterium phosphoreum]